jgi:hypothetical protein
MADHEHVESAAAPEPAPAPIAPGPAPTGLAGGVLTTAGPTGVVEYLAGAADDTRAAYVRGLQRTIGNREVSRLILARATPLSPPAAPPSSLIPEGDPHGGMRMDPEVLKRAAQERAKIGVADEDFHHRNVAVIKFERDGKVGYIATANVPEALHSEEVLIGKLNADDPGMTKTKILEVFSEREPCASKCKPLLEQQRAKMKYDFPLHHWVPEKGTLGERAELLRGKYRKEGLLTQLTPKKGPIAGLEPEVSAKKSVPKGKGTKSAPKAKKIKSPGPGGMGLKKSPGPLKGPIINFGVGIGTALLTSLMHDAILNSVQAMPRPTLQTVDIWSRDGMGKAGPP